MTFSVPRDHRIYDDRFVWVNPHDSDHVIKLDDGGLGTSYDRGDHFLYHTALPLSQYYRVSVDMAHPTTYMAGFRTTGLGVDLVSDPTGQREFSMRTGISGEAMDF